MKKSQVFNQVPVKRPKKSFFDLSHEVKMSGKFSFLYPCLVQECLPGDVFKNTSTILLRFAPMLSPVMHRVDVVTHFFFVPNRLLWDSWEDFITGGRDGTVAPIPPYMTPFGLNAATLGSRMQEGTLWDYLGLPVKPTATVASSVEQISALPFRAYSKIFNDYYRDPNLTAEVAIGEAQSGDVSASLWANQITSLYQKGWEKDYFTSLLPWAQRGTQVLMPISASGTANFYPTINILDWVQADGGLPPAGAVTIGAVGGERRLTDSTGENILPLGTVPVTIPNANTTINDLRTSLAIQTWLEVNARAGYRYNEQIYSHFSTRVPDYRLNRAEYLGGGRQPVVISEVLSTAKTTNGAVVTPVGDLNGHGISVGKSNTFRYHCQEHGIILGIMSVIPRTAYQQGIPKLFSRQTKFDYAWPEMAHLGEQAVPSKEIFYDFLAAGDAANAATMGYAPRYSEYKYQQDRVAGAFRSTLQFWHLGRIFASRPTLNSVFTTFNENNPTIEVTYRRIFAVQDGSDYLWIDIFHRLGASRPLPYFGVPRLIG